MKFHFAGAEGNYSNYLKKHNVNNILESAFYLSYKNPSNKLNFNNVIMDSGGFTLIKNKISVPVERYAEFLNFNKKIKVAINLDVISIEQTLKNQDYLDKHCKTYIMPVYHYSDYADRKYRNLINHYAEKYNYIAVAGMGCKDQLERDKFYEHCFSICTNKVKLHGLASTGMEIMKKFPFYSVDSSSWLNSIRFGTYMEFKNGTIIKHNSLYVCSKKSNKKIDNVNLINSTNAERLKSTIIAYLGYEKYITNLWKERGIVYEDFIR